MKGDAVMNENYMNPEEQCTHDCSTCGSACTTEKRGPSFFDRMDTISSALEEVGEENIIAILNETLEEWESEDQAE